MPQNAGAAPIISAASVQFRTRYVEARGGSEDLASAFHEMLVMAGEIDGARAFDCPKTSAAIHEAGHCVVAASQGVIPEKASIWPIVELGRLQWVGRTYGLPSWRVDGASDPQADLRQAQSQLAGVVSEALFDPDYRQGSSIDEIVIAQGIVATVARKLSHDPKQLWFETLLSVVRQLKGHKKTVQQISNVLLRGGSVKARKLRQLLQPVGYIDA